MIKNDYLNPLFYRHLQSISLINRKSNFYKKIAFFESKQV